MKVTKKIIAVVLTVLSMNAYSGVQRLTIGDKEITVNFPAGYTNACEKSNELKAIFSSSTPPTHNLLACYLENGEFDLYPDVDPEADNPYLLIQELKSLSHRTLTLAQFKGLRSTIIAQQKSMFDNLPEDVKTTMNNAGNEVSKVLATSVNIDMVGIIPLGVISNTENNIAFALIRKLKVESGADGTFIGSEVIVQNMVLIDGKLLILNAAKTYTTDRDLDALRKLILEWGSGLKAPNK